MEKTVFTPVELCDRWGFTKPTIQKLEDEGILERCLLAQGHIRYTAKSVYEAEKSSFNPFSPMERRRLERENQKLQEEVAEQKRVIYSITSMVANYMGGAK